jgi:hypothetical protein
VIIIKQATAAAATNKKGLDKREEYDNKANEKHHHKWLLYLYPLPPPQPKYVKF